MTRDEVEAAVARLDREAIAAARWSGASDRAIDELTLDEAFALDDTGSHALAIVSARLDDGSRHRYQLALTGSPLRLAEPGEGSWRSLAVAMSEGRTIPALPVDPARPDVSAALVCRPGPAMPSRGPGAERDLAADQSNTSVVLGDDVLLKAYRQVLPGLNPDLEMTAFLSEQARFPAVPPVAGYAELVERRRGGGAATLAMAQRYVAEGADAYESIAEVLTSWLLAPGEVSVEHASDVAADLGTLTAGLHVAVTSGASGGAVPEMAPRPATRAELRAWSERAREHLEQALDVVPRGSEAARTLRDLAPRIAETLTAFDAISATPEVVRAHGDLHLGQILVAPDGYRIIDFEGEPFSTLEERRQHRHPLRDVASMLRSLDHVGRSAGRRAVARNGGPLDRAGLDLPGWLRRSRVRFLEAYREGLSEARVWVDMDPTLLLAFEVDKELYEFVYAARYLPSWLWAPTEGMAGLFEASP